MHRSWHLMPLIPLRFLSATHGESTDSSVLVTRSCSEDERSIVDSIRSGNFGSRSVIMVGEFDYLLRSASMDPRCAGCGEWSKYMYANDQVVLCCPMKSGNYCQFRSECKPLRLSRNLLFESLSKAIKKVQNPPVSGGRCS